MSSLKQTVSCLLQYNGDKQAINAAELGRRERFRVFASSRPRRESILTTRNAKTRYR